MTSRRNRSKFHFSEIPIAADLIPFFTSMKDWTLSWYQSHGAYPLYLTSFILSVLACTGMGLLTLFSIFAKHLDSVLHLEPSQINTIIVLQVLGMNICTPLSGYIADAKGIWILPTMAMVGYTISFGLLFISLDTHLDPFWIYLAFFIMGGTHVAFLFSCLLNSAKSFGRYYTTLAISSPNLMTAFSSFVQIKIIQSYLSGGDDKTNFRNILTFFFSMVIFNTILSLLACKLTDHVNEFEGDDIERFESFETSPLLSGAGAVIHSPNIQGILGSPRSWYVDESAASSIGDLSLDPLSIVIDKSDYHKKINKFMRDPFMYLLMICCLTSMSASEFFIANLNSILVNLGLRDQLDHSLQVFSITATCTRFTIMMFTDFVCTRMGISRLTIFTFVVICSGISYLYLSSTPISLVDTTIILIANAVLNSTVFTLFPAILACVYGMDILGTTWGVFCSSSIVGNVIFNTMYSFDFSSNCLSNFQNTLSICSTTTFLAGGIILITFGVLVFLFRNVYIKRAGEFF